MRTEWRILLLALAATFWMACPGPKVLDNGLKLQGLEPQAFSYGGIPVFLLENERDPLEIRLLLRHSNSPQQVTALLAALRDLEQSWDYENNGHLSFLDLQVESVPGWAILNMSCLPKHLQANWPVIERIFEKEKLDKEAIAKELQDQREYAPYFQKLPAVQIEQLMYRELGYFAQGPSNLRSIPGLEAVESDEEVQKGWEALRRKENMRLVIAGNLDAEELGDLLFDNFAVLPGESDSMEVNDKTIHPSGLYGVDAGTYIPRMSLLMQFSGGKELQGSIAVLAVVIRQRLELAFERDAQVRADMSVVASSSQLPSIHITLNGRNVIPQAELVISELRRLKEEGMTEDEFKRARNVALTIALSRFDSNRAWANAVAKYVAQGELHFFDELRGIKSASPKSLSKSLQNNWESANWFLSGDTSKVDEQVLLRF